MKKLLLLLPIFTFISCNIHDIKVKSLESKSQKKYFVSSETAKSVALSFLSNSRSESNKYASFNNTLVPGFENKKIDKVLMVPDKNKTPQYIL